MAIRTLCISRNISSIEGVPNGIPLGNIFDIVDGDRVNEFNKQPSQRSIFYFKTVDLTDDEFNLVKNDISGDVSKTVSLNIFSQHDIDELSIRGEKPSNLGGDVNFDNIIRRNKIGPTLSDYYPMINKIGSNSISIKVKAVEEGHGYAVIVPRFISELSKQIEVELIENKLDLFNKDELEKNINNDIIVEEEKLIPSSFISSEQVKTGNNILETPISKEHIIDIEMDANKEYVLEFLNLEPSTEYSISFVMENENIQETPAVLIATTGN
jgi:hypothetical protein